MEEQLLYKFGSFHLHPAEHLLLRQGQPVAITPKAFDLLVYLVERRGRLVTKDQLLTALWPDSFVEEANLTVCVSGLRKTLGEKRGKEQYIDTIPKKGYRFVAEVVEVQDPNPVAGGVPGDVLRSDPEPVAPSDTSADVGSLVNSRRNHAGLDAEALALAPTQRKESVAPDSSEVPQHTLRFVFAAGICVAVVALAFTFVQLRKPKTATTHKTLAVLPFQNLKHDSEADFLGFSLADAIINRLGYVTELTVRPSYAVKKYRNETPDLQQVARTLSVDTLLTGTFLREGDHLRVGYQFVDPKSNYVLRQGTVDVNYDNLLAVEDQVAAQVISTLSVTLSPSESALMRGGHGIPPAAYEYYLRGVDLYSRNDFPLAIKMLEKSTELYGDYPLTWAHLGRSYTASASFNFGGEELYRKARAVYERALNLQPDLLIARIYMANLMTDTGQPEQAVPLLREALRINPNLAEAHWELGYAYRHGGLLEESIAEAKRARELDPGVKLTSSAVNGYLYLGEYAVFLRSLPPPGDSAFIEFYRGFAQYHVSPDEQAAQIMDRAYELDPSMLQAQVGKALAHHVRRADKQGLALLKSAETRVAQQSVHDPEAIYKIAQAYSELGDQASAIRNLRWSVEGGFFPDLYFVRDPLMNTARHDPQFGPIVEAARQRSEAFRKQFP